MTYTIKPGSGNLNWSAHGVDRILQNVQNLLSLAAYEVAFDRTRGLPTSLMDMPRRRGGKSVYCKSDRTAAAV